MIPTISYLVGVFDYWFKF